MNKMPPGLAVRFGLDTLEELAASFPGVMLLETVGQGRIVSCSPSFLTETGYRADRMVGLPLQRVIVSGCTGLTSDRFAEIRLVRSNGSIMKGSAIRVAAEPADGTECDPAGRDIILMISPGEAMRRSELVERFGQAMLTDDHIGIILLHSHDFRILDISPLACRLLGAPKHELLGETLSRFFVQAEYEYGLIREVLEGGDPVRNFPLTWLNGNERKELLMDVGLLPGSVSGTGGAYLIFKDITNLRSLEQQVQRSDRLSMIGQIAAGAAHEIRNPLTSLKGFLQMFRKTLSDRDMQKEVEYADIMLTELERINNLVNEFLLLSKPRNVNSETFDLTLVLREIMPIISSEALLHDVSVSWDIEQGMYRVMADRELLKQVFLNICKNGIEAMMEGGALTITARTEFEKGMRWTMIDIRDTGPGIPPHMLERIFDPFITTKTNGTGLGLSVCQRILHDLGGSIQASSGEKGAVFSIKLPC
ncbi:PAS domain-containing sensor histidine kinase [Paenibacillus humicola]|uniref:PAS domain-containing sensor histidine kinase n=1 Tax=Paenibacillus humicola TaxID=3110540 RepID=UPI00237BD4CB|nr:PAS domain-containing sensor histidine kinase [Paenibacillus humicola]